MGGTGHWPVPSGYQPDGMAATWQNRLVCPPSGMPEFPPVPCGQWPHGTARLAVLPNANCIVPD